MSSTTNRVCALIPAYNESDRIGVTIDALKSRRDIWQVVVVDDGSTDNTADVARKAGADIVITQKNAGKGAALTAAFRQTPDADIYLLLDADLAATAAEAIKLLSPVVMGQADMVIGLLPPDPDFAASGESGGSGMVVRLASDGIRRATGQTFKQPLCGQRAVRREVLEAIDRLNGNKGSLFAKGFGVEVGLTIAALRAGFKVIEVETQFRHKVTGSDWSGIMHRARQYLDVAKAVRESRGKTPV